MVVEDSLAPVGMLVKVAAGAPGADSHKAVSFQCADQFSYRCVSQSVNQAATTSHPKTPMTSQLGALSLCVSSLGIESPNSCNTSRNISVLSLIARMVSSFV